MKKKKTNDIVDKEWSTTLKAVKADEKQQEFIVFSHLTGLLPQLSLVREREQKQKKMWIEAPFALLFNPLLPKVSHYFT